MGMWDIVRGRLKRNDSTRVSKGSHGFFFLDCKKFEVHTRITGK